jgi:hypothetical protein
MDIMISKTRSHVGWQTPGRGLAELTAAVHTGVGADPQLHPVLAFLAALPQIIHRIQW